MRRALMLALAGAAVAGCSAQPGPPGSEVRVVVMRGLTAAEHARNEQWSSEAERRGFGWKTLMPARSCLACSMQVSAFWKSPVAL